MTTIAGVAIPDSSLAREATAFVRDTSTQLLFDHSRRVFLWASLEADQLTRGPCLIEVLTAGVHDKPETAVGNMMADVLEATVPGYVRPNICDDIRSSRFET
jgi:hypothetical protein